MPASAQEPPPALAVTKADVAAALKVAGLEFSEAEIELMLSGVNRARTGYARLRDLEVPLSTEPGFAFHPWLPGREPAPAREIFRPSVFRAPRQELWKSDDQLAFLPVITTPPLSNALPRPEQFWSPSSPWARSRKADSGSAG